MRILQLLDKEEDLRMVLYNKNKTYLTLETIAVTIIFELKRQWKIFLGFAIASFVFVLSLSILPYVLIPDYPLPETQNAYFQEGLQFFIIIILIAACLFFSGIICSEYGNRTGYIVFPIIKKQKVFIGKFIGGLIYLYLIIGVFYLTLGLAGLAFYGELIDLYFISLSFALICCLAICCFISLMSSVLKNTTISIVVSITILLVGDRIFSTLISLVAPDFEPLFSLNYASNILIYVFEDDFLLGVMVRFREQYRMGFETIVWLTPSLEAGLAIFISYMGISLVPTFLFLKRRQL